MYKPKLHKSRETLGLGFNCVIVRKNKIIFSLEKTREPIDVETLKPLSDLENSKMF